MFNTILLIQTISLTNVPYYFDRRIHNLGNIGYPGKIHAEGALLSTRVIDIIRYGGRNIRKEIMDPYQGKTILDLCCGIGISTVENGIGVDTSFEMLKVGQRLNSKYDMNKTFYLSNAETYVSSENIDIVTCMFAFHEMPEYAHKKIIENAKKIANEEVIIVDIASDYKPKEIMLSGEPYLLDYMSTIDKTLGEFEKTVYIDGHVHIWKYKCE